MGWKKACDANEGTCDLLLRLLALWGLLVFEIDPPGPPNAPPDLHPGDVLDVPGKGVPLLDEGARAD